MIMYLQQLEWKMNKENSLYQLKETGQGFGAMDIYGIGYSIVRINKNGNTSLYEYNTFNKLPEEVYIHEFLHSLERILQEDGYEIPQLHDYEKYGYIEDATIGLREWYSDYMTKNILNKETGEKVGLDEAVYLMQPYHHSDFKYSTEIEFNKEPSNLIEEIKGIFKAIKKAF